MKLGIYTIVDNSNYGNRLQNYASNVLLSKYGETYTILDKSQLIEKKSLNKKIAISIKSLLSKKYCFYRTLLDNFILFSDKYIPIKIHLLKKDEVIDEYDLVFVGSDQVWNTDFTIFNDLFFLPFIPKEKRMCMAPSFGKEYLNDEFVEMFKEGLSNFKVLNVREEKGKELIYKLIGKEVYVLSDPTLLLKTKEWEAVADSKYTPKKPYILTYFLGNFPKEANDILVNLQSDYEIIHLDTPSFGKSVPAGPQHFIDLIKNANLVLTNSFHATVFSILFERAYITFERKDRYSSMNSRIETLLQNLQQENRMFHEGIDIFYKDYKTTSQILKQKREKDLKYIQTLIKGSVLNE